MVNIAFAHGLILALMVTATMRISGHLNPAVTAGFLAMDLAFLFDVENGGQCTFLAMLPTPEEALRMAEEREASG